MPDPVSRWQYFTRGSLTYCAPVMLLDPSLGMSITDVGAMTSAFPLAYGFSMEDVALSYIFGYSVLM